MFSKEKIAQTALTLSIVLSVAVAIVFVLLLESKSLIFSYATKQAEAPVTPFPVSVNLETETIVEQPGVDSFFTNTLAIAPNSRQNWWNKVAAFFADEDWYQNLASPVSRIVVIWPGERKEEAIKRMGDILGWKTSDRDEFQALMHESAPEQLLEGTYYPSQYTTHRGASPADMQELVYGAFEQEILKRYTPEVDAQVPLADALIIASLLEREASDFTNMREVSGVIWNRLFTDMPLQLDATLQYIRGSNTYEPRWWPAIRPADKFTASPYNTYKNAGLPPTPIANPSAEAVLAALNPLPTDCLFYFHTSNGTYHCSVTYSEHVGKLRSIYGRGS